MRKFIIGGLAAAASISLLTACSGADNSTEATAAAVTTETTPVATVGDVTDEFTMWRKRRAAKVSTGSISITVSDITCELGKPGFAECYETVKFDGAYGTRAENMVWNVEYDRTDGEITFAKSIG